MNLLILLVIVALLSLASTIGFGIFWLKAQKKESFWRYKYEGLRRDQDRLENSVSERKQRLAREHEESVNNFQTNVEASNAHFLAQALVGESAKELRKETKSVIENKYSRMSQELVGSITDEAEGLSRELHINLSERIWDSIQQMKEKNDESPYIMPCDCRIAYTKGSRTVVVIEQSPQVRTISCTPSIVGTASAKASVSQTNSAYRFNLAFPYVYFVIAFDYGKYNSHELYFRNKPLSSVREHIYLAPIPNVFRSKKHGNNSKDKMCMGMGFQGDVHGELTIARQSEMVVADFWQRTFNEHLGMGGFDKIPELKDWRNWQKKSEEDSLFILKVKWKKGKTIKGVVDAMLEQRDRKHKLDGIDKNLRKILDKGVSNVSTHLKEEIAAAKTKHTLQKDDLDDTVRDSLEKVVCSHTKKVFAHCQKG